MLVCSFRLAVVTLDGEGNVIGRKAGHLQTSVA